MKRARSLLFVVFCASNLCAAQRTFVSAANGNDANPCSRALPCRNFAAALPQTDPDGEVIVLDSGGYGAVTITQPVSLISPSGVHGGITAFSGDAVRVSAGDTAHVVLRNLSLISQGAANGILAVDTVAALYVENCVISDFGSYGIAFEPATSHAGLYVSDTLVRRSGQGIHVGGGTGTGIRSTLDSVWLYENSLGVEVFEAQATIQDSVANGGEIYGFHAALGSDIMIESSVAAGNGYGFYANSGLMTLTRCTATSNANFGILAELTGTTIWVSNSTITTNGTGVAGSFGAVVTSRGNNTLQANATDGIFTSTFPQN
jgi:parallel beta helix pectate lyase-like protein